MTTNSKDNNSAFRTPHSALGDSAFDIPHSEFDTPHSALGDSALGASALGRILIVDDDPFVLDVALLLLESGGYSVITSSSGKDALAKLQKEVVDIVLSDIKMPEMTGIELLEKIHTKTPDMPVILVTAFADLDIAIDAIKKGAFDFITKPYKLGYLIHAVGKALKWRRMVEFEKNYKRMLEIEVMEKTKEIAELSKEVVLRLTSAAEFRDTDTGAHISRIGLYANKISEAQEMPSEFVGLITYSAALHDIGKIGIPDKILLKPGALTPDEFEVMKAHTTIGENMLSGSSQPVIKMASAIALNHHERWDGTGYPMGLKGDNIPIEGRIVNICDQYDALMSKRPYKSALGHKEVFSIITEGDGRTIPGHFAPEVLKAFIEVAPVFEEIFNTHQDMVLAE